MTSVDKPTPPPPAEPDETAGARHSDRRQHGPGRQAARSTTCATTSRGCAAATWARCPASPASSCWPRFFSFAHPQFHTVFNFGNMFTEGTATIFIAMGLVFVLLLGEIDLAAGYTAGVCARP